MTVTYYDKKGNEIEKPMQGLEYKICAKKAEGENTVRYFLATANGVLVDPKTMNDSQMKRYSTKMKEVGFQAFDKYLFYLKSDNTRLSINSIDRMF